MKNLRNTAENKVVRQLRVDVVGSNGRLYFFADFFLIYFFVKSCSVAFGPLLGDLVCPVLQAGYAEGPPSTLSLLFCSLVILIHIFLVFPLLFPLLQDLALLADVGELLAGSDFVPVLPKKMNAFLRET